MTNLRIGLGYDVHQLAGGRARGGGGPPLSAGETLRRRIDYGRRRRAEGKRSAKLRFLRVFSIFTACIQ